MTNRTGSLADQEERIEHLYRRAAEVFSQNHDFSLFLSTLADQEADHARLLRSLPKPHESKESVFESETFNVTLQEAIEYLTPVMNDLDSAKMSEERMLEVVVHLEFSEWNSIFLLAMSSANPSDRDFLSTLKEIEKHRGTVENYLLQTSARDELYQTINTLAPLWKRRILILDDDPVIARLLSIIMAPYGDLEVSTHPEDALKKLKGKGFDVIISDVCMPAMDGIEFYQQAIALDPALCRHFLFYSATTCRDHLHFIADHQIPLLKKPAPLKVLQQAMTELLH